MIKVITSPFVLIKDNVMINRESRWSEIVWQKHLPIYQQTQQLPFIQELISGQLNPQRFMFYIEQDALYLQSFTRLLRSMIERIAIPKYQQYFRDFLHENMAAEQALHETYLRRDLQWIEPTETCKGFIEFNDTLAEMPLEIALAGMLPCFIVYQQLGVYIYENHVKEGNPYLAWIDMYAGIEHSESVRKLREVCDHYGQDLPEFIAKQMDQEYLEGCLWDQKFWQSCYEMK